MPELGPLSLGTANLGNLRRAMTDEQAWQVLETAWACGVRYFDTAPHYGLGLSERRLGEFLATKPRESYTISTKVGRLLRADPAGVGRFDDEHDFVVPADHARVWDFSATGIRQSLRESLKRLGMDAVDIAYLHDPEVYGLESALASGVPALAALRDEGVVGWIGVGSKSTAALLAGARTQVLDLLMVAGRLTLLEQSAAAEVVPACQDQGMGIVNAAVYGTGLLATARPTAGDWYDYGPPSDPVLERARAIAAVCEEFGVELPAAALRYASADPVVRTVVVGGATPGEVRQNDERLRAPVPGELWIRLRGLGLIS